MVEEAMVGFVLGKLPDKSRFRLKDVKAAVDQATDAENGLKLPIDLPFLRPGRDLEEKISREDLEHEIRDFAQLTVARTLRVMDANMPNAEAVLRGSVLQVVDQGWSEHLEAMEVLKLGVQWQAVGQKDPEVEYKLGAFELYQETLGRVKAQVVSSVLADFAAYATVFSSDFQPATIDPKE